MFNILFVIEALYDNCKNLMNLLITDHPWKCLSIVQSFRYLRVFKQNISASAKTHPLMTLLFDLCIFTCCSITQILFDYYVKLETTYQMPLQTLSTKCSDFR